MAFQINLKKDRKKDKSSSTALTFIVDTFKWVLRWFILFIVRAFGAPESLSSSR